MDNPVFKNELFWFFGILLPLMGFLVIIESSKFSEVIIVLLAFTLNWLIYRYIAITLWTRNSRKESIKHETIWFVSILGIFLMFVMLVGDPTSFEIVIIISVYTLVWTIRSYFVKKNGLQGLNQI